MPMNIENNIDEFDVSDIVENTDALFATSCLAISTLYPKQPSFLITINDASDIELVNQQIFKIIKDEKNQVEIISKLYKIYNNLFDYNDLHKKYYALCYNAVDNNYQLNCLNFNRMLTTNVQGLYCTDEELKDLNLQVQQPDIEQFKQVYFYSEFYKLYDVNEHNYDLFINYVQNNCVKDYLNRLDTKDPISNDKLARLLNIKCIKTNWYSKNPTYIVSHQYNEFNYSLPQQVLIDNSHNIVNTMDLNQLEKIDRTKLYDTNDDLFSVEIEPEVIYPFAKKIRDIEIMLKSIDRRFKIINGQNQLYYIALGRRIIKEFKRGDICFVKIDKLNNILDLSRFEPVDIHTIENYIIILNSNMFKHNVGSIYSSIDDIFEEIVDMRNMYISRSYNCIIKIDDNKDIKLIKKPNKIKIKLNRQHQIEYIIDLFKSISNKKYEYLKNRHVHLYNYNSALEYEERYHLDKINLNIEINNNELHLYVESKLSDLFNEEQISIIEFLKSILNDEEKNIPFDELDQLDKIKNNEYINRQLTKMIFLFSMRQPCEYNLPFKGVCDLIEDMKKIRTKKYSW